MMLLSRKRETVMVKMNKIFSRKKRQTTNCDEGEDGEDSEEYTEIGGCDVAENPERTVGLIEEEQEESLEELWRVIQALENASI